MSNPAVLIVDDDANLRASLFDTLDDKEHRVVVAGSGREALDVIEKQDIGLLVSDLQMQPMDGTELLGRVRERHPTLPTVFMSAHSSVERAVDVMRMGAVDFLVKPFDIERLRAIISRYLVPVEARDVPVAADPHTIELLRIAKQVAATEATLTISGESGCGKEVFARYIHQNSPRSKHPFIAINCAAIPENMLEAVLFGYEKGAYTGANSAHAGKFEQAQHGTLLLDEVSEMDLGLQAKLLRVIQEKEVERLGGRGVIPLDVRVLATTNRNLRQHVDEQKFREDLYYRLNVFPLRILPLRERKGDILPLAGLALRKHAMPGRSIPALTGDAEKRLLAHQWPGNVRELENVIQRSLILTTGDVIDASDLALDACLEDARPKPDSNAALQDDLKLREFEVISSALAAAHGNRTIVARELGISPRTLRYKLARMRDEGFEIEPGRQSKIASVAEV